MVGDEALGLADQTDELPDLAIAAGQFAQQAPTHGMGRHLEEHRWTHGER